MSSHSRETVAGGETSTQRVARLMLGQSVHAFIAERRSSDKPMSWRLIAQDLSAKTDGAVNVTEMTLRTWAQQDVAA